MRNMSGIKGRSRSLRVGVGRAGVIFRCVWATLPLAGKGFARAANYILGTGGW